MDHGTCQELEKNQKNPFLVLVLGGARSGKSAFAEGLLQRLCARPVYVATAEARDGEMSQRITAHREMRGEGWRTFEAPLDPLSVLSDLNEHEGVLLDCLTLWLSNQMENEADLDDESARLLSGFH